MLFLTQRKRSEFEMRKKKSDKGILLSVIIFILGVLCMFFGTFVTEKISLNNNQKTNEETNENNEQDDTTKNFYDVNELNVDALDGYQVFDDISNNTNIIESVRVGDKYFANLNLTGHVKITSYTTEKEITGNLTLSGVIDMIIFDVVADESEQLLYLLTDHGDVYYYRLGNSENKDFNATKVENVSNVKKIFISHLSKANAGGSWALFAITENNDCIMLKGESV